MCERETLTNRQKDREKDRQTDRGRERERERDREAETERLGSLDSPNRGARPRRLGQNWTRFF